MWLGAGKNIDSSMHCNIFFPNLYRFIKSSESIPASGSPWPPVPHWTPLGLCLQQLEAPRVQPRSRFGGWCAAETLLELWGRVADVWRTTLSETVNSQRGWSHPGRCTVRPWIALSSGKRGSVSMFYPLVSSWRAEGPQLCLCLCQTKMYHAVL